jgi:hypothetical protein
MARISLVLAALLLLTPSPSFAQGSGCATATNVIPGTSPNGIITNAVTVHYWKITIPLNGYLRVQINSEAALNVDATLYDSMPDTSSALSNDNQIGPLSAVWGFLKPGTYYVKIWRVNGVGTYTMTTSFSSSARPSDPELNDTPKLASPLNANGSSTGNMGYIGNRATDLEDWWKIAVPEDGFLRVQIIGDSLDARGEGYLFQLDAEMYDTNGTSRIFFDFRSGTYSEVWQFVRAGTYFVHLGRSSGRAASYQITSTFTPPSRASDPDGNDAPQTATSALVNGTVTGRINYLRGGIFNSDDYWKFTLPSDGKVVVQLVADSLDAVGEQFNLDLSLYEISGARMDRFVFDARGGTFSECTAYVIGGRTFHVRISRISGHGASYSLKVIHTPMDKSGDVEPNDWFGAANQLTLNVVSTGHLGCYGYVSNDTYDYWKITATTTDSMYVHVTSDAILEANLAGWGPDTLQSYPLIMDLRSGAYSRVGIKPTVGVTYYFRVERVFTLPSWYSIIATRSYVAVDVEKCEMEAIVPTNFQLEQNYPNPFNPTTTFRYSLPESQHVSIVVYSLLGQEITEIVNAVQAPGTYRVVWNGKNCRGVDVPSGVYPVRLLAGKNQLITKAMLLR